MKFEKMIPRDKRIKNNSMFTKDEGNFYRKVNEKTEYIGRTPTMEKFTDVWAGIWEEYSVTPETKWIKEIETRLREKIRIVEEFKVREKDLADIKKEKELVCNWN